jgi:chemotaxis protein CheC
VSSPLDELETDGLAELFNLSVGRAAASLARLVRHEIGMSVPSVALVAIGAAAEMLPRDDGDGLVVVHSAFSGGLTGTVALVLPARASLELVALALQDESAGDAADFEQDALQEIGNIVVNACLAGLADAFGGEIATAIPSVARGERGAVMMRLAPEARGQVLLLTIEFGVRARRIEGHLAFVLDETQIAEFRARLRVYIERIMAGG